MSNFSSTRPSRLRSSRYLKGRDSESPTLSRTHSQKSIWARSYKNQPIPTELRTRLIGKKYQFGQNSDSDEEIMAVMEEEELEPVEKKKKRLPKFKVISDWGEFTDVRRSGISSERKFHNSPQRCHSVASLKLPQVLEQKREDDDLRRRGLSKLAEFKDKNQFGQNKKRRSSSQFTDVVSHVQSLELPNQRSRLLPEQIEENEAEETKSVKLANQKSIITAELEKIIVDEVDEKLRKKEQISAEIESIIEEQKPEEEINTERLSQSLSRFSSQSSYLNKLKDEEDFSRKPDVAIQQEEEVKSQ